MTTYIDTQSSQYPISEADIRAAFPNTSFPVPFAPPEQFAVVFPSPQPAYDRTTEAVREAAPVLTDKGFWEQRWEVVPRFVDYTGPDGTLHTAAEQLAAEMQRQRDATVLRYTAALEAHYDSKAQEKRYDNRFTCALRAGYAGPFQPEGAAFAVWMDICNAYAYGVMAEVTAGTRAMPTIPELIAELPPLVWPS